MRSFVRTAGLHLKPVLNANSSFEECLHSLLHWNCVSLQSQMSDFTPTCTHQLLKPTPTGYSSCWLVDYAGASFVKPSREHNNIFNVKYWTIIVLHFALILQSRLELIPLEEQQPGCKSVTWYSAALGPQVWQSTIASSSSLVFGS